MKVNGLNKLLNDEFQACEPAMKWVRRQRKKTPRQAWYECARPDWLVFVMGAAGIPAKHLVQNISLIMLETIKMRLKGVDPKNKPYWAEVKRRLTQQVTSGRRGTWWDTVEDRFPTNKMTAPEFSIRGLCEGLFSKESSYSRYQGKLDSSSGAFMNVVSSVLTKDQRTKLATKVRRFYPWSRFKSYAHALVEWAVEHEAAQQEEEAYNGSYGW